MSGVDVRKVLEMMRAASDAGHRIAMDAEGARAVLEHVERLEIKKERRDLEIMRALELHQQMVEDAKRENLRLSVQIWIALVSAVVISCMIAWWLG